MDVRFTEEQQALRDAVRSLLADKCPMSHVRAVMEGETGADLALYHQLVALGIADLPGPIEQSIVFEECGRALVPAPVVTALGIAVPALEAAAPGHTLLKAIREGEAIPVLASNRDRVADAAVATHLLFYDGGQLRVAEAANCGITPLATMDATRRLGAVQGLSGEAVGPASRAQDAVVTRGRVALAAELVGLGQACLDLAVAHARGREQFGRPIGAYQAVSHRCVDMFVALETARSHMTYAAWAVQAQATDAAFAANQANAAASEAAVLCAHGAIQVHGGIGFTWEHDLHLYLKRARSSAALLGTPSELRQLVAATLLEV